ncbi:MAG: hypothetical protein KDA94_06795 [Acidimicrobiales bacterium]|nr:hypothetical protein [Acidimicrobiales bacterium]
MKWALLGFLSTTGVVIVGLCIVALLARSRMRRRHRVDPAIATAAPATWMVDPRQAARIHRRLAAVGRLAGRVADDHRAPKRLGRRAPEQPPLVGVATDLRTAAVQLDHQVCRVAMLAPAARRPHLDRLAAATRDLERAAARLESISATVLAPPVLATEAHDITDLAAQLDRLAEAHRLLVEIDERNGLVTPVARSPQTQRAARAN